MKYTANRIPSIPMLCLQISTVSMLLLVAGCASTKAPEQQVYMLRSVLSDEVMIQGSVGLANAKMRITDVSTAAYLSQPGLVTADPDGVINTANYHLWAELPEVAIKRRLERCFLQDTKSQRKPQLIQLEVHSFQGDGDGGVVFGGIWTSTLRSERAAKNTYLFEYRERQLDDGYGSLVTALSQTVQNLCNDILEKAHH